MAPSMEVSQIWGSQLYGQFQDAGEAGLVVKRATGAPPQLTTEPRAQLPELFSTGAEYDGFEGEVWTSRCVGEVLKPHLGGTAEVATIGLLRKPLGLTLQKPTLCSYRQNPQCVAPWREETLPELKHGGTRPASHFVAESACYLLPQVRQTWAPAGHTPILSEGCQAAHWSVLSAINEPGDLYYQLRDTSYPGREVAQFSRDLCGLTPPKLLLIWDGASIPRPRRQEVKDLLRQEDFAGRVQLALLPCSRPQLAAEPVWAWLKGGQLKTGCCQTLDELTRQVQQAFAKLTENTEIIPPCYEPPEVSFY